MTPHAAPRAGRALADLLGADDHRDDQVRRPDHARRQQGRRRRAGAGDAGAPGPERPAAGRRRASSPCSRSSGSRCSTATRMHHAGDLGAAAVEGLDVVAPGLRRPMSCRCRWSSWSGCSSCRAAAPHGSATCSGRSCCCGSSSWRVLGVVADRQASPHVLLALNPLYGIDLIARPRPGHLLGLRLDRAGGDRRGGALCRHGPFRPQADPPGLALHRAARPDAQLFRPGRADPRDPDGGAPGPFFELVPDMALCPLVVLSTLATVIASQAVISGVFSLTRAGDAAGLPAAHGDQAHLGDRDRPDLHPAGQLDPDDRHRGARRAASARPTSWPAPTASPSPAPCWSTPCSPTVVAILVWRWKWPVALAVFGLLAIPDIAFFIANALKIPDGGWLPLLVAAWSSSPSRPGAAAAQWWCAS